MAGAVEALFVGFIIDGMSLIINLTIPGILVLRSLGGAGKPGDC